MCFKHDMNKPAKNCSQSKSKSKKYEIESHVAMFLYSLYHDHAKWAEKLTMPDSRKLRNKIPRRYITKITESF